MKVRYLKENDFNEVAKLVAKFRVALGKFKSKNKKEDLNSAKEELKEYKQKNYPVYVAEYNSKIVGYLVCKVDDNVVWVESIYVLPKYRNKGIASSLYKKAEELGNNLGNETIYNWVHPNNYKMINFLKKQGYDLLNLIEIRKKIKNEKIIKKIKIDEQEFKY